jgi:hypothetical protein
MSRKGSAPGAGKAETHAWAEAAAAEDLRGAGFGVTNLNELAGSFPAADLAARRAGERLLVQVRGTTKTSGDFPAPPEGARTLYALADAVDCHGIYCFVQFVGDDRVIRFDTAARVAELAEATEAAYGHRTYLHVNIEDFDVTADRISELLK